MAITGAKSVGMVGGATIGCLFTLVGCAERGKVAEKISDESGQKFERSLEKRSLTKDAIRRTTDEIEDESLKSKIGHRMLLCGADETMEPLKEAVKEGLRAANDAFLESGAA